MNHNGTRLCFLFREFVWCIVGVEFDIQIMLTSYASLANGCTCHSFDVG